MKRLFSRTAAMLALMLLTTATAWAQHSPTLSVEACEGKRGSLYVKGWCEDPDATSTPLTVEVHIVDANHNHVQGSPIRLTANVRRFGSDNQWHNNGFDNYIPITTADTYRVAVYANDATGDSNTTWNEYYVQVPVSAPYTVTYNANGGSGAPASQMKHHGIDLTLSNTVPTRSGQTFARWSTKADGTGTNYDCSGTYTGNADVTLYAIWGNSVPYLEYSTYNKRFENKLASSPIPVSSITTSMGTGGQESWYVVTGNVTVDSRIEVNGYVNLILCDGATLTASQGIAVNDDGLGQSLSIFGQTASTGTLNAYGVKITADGSAAIGSTGGNNHVFGKVFIHGGVINADGAEWTAGIGGGVNQGGGRVELLGGTISARGHKGESQAVGKGSGGANVERYIADGLRVTVGDNTTPVNKDDRVNALNSVDVWVKASPCTNHSVTNHVCNYCGMTCYSVTYDPNGATSGTVPSTTFYQNNATVTVPGNTGSLTRQGYTFTGWNKRADGNGFNYTSGETFEIWQDVTLYAKWTPITYTVRFNKNHSDATGTMNDQSFTYNIAQNLTANGFSRIGYDFMGWSTTPNGSVSYTNGQSVNNLATQNWAVVNLYAVWQPTTYSITYDLAGGSVATPNPTSYTVQSDAITLVNPTREGYTFTGWTGTGLNGPTMTVTIPHGSLGDRSYKATWTLTYTISYDLAGGSVATPNPTTYTEVSSDITLVNPTRDGYTFAGWMGTDLNEPTISVTIANGSTGNRSYTATWVSNYALTYDLAGGTASNPTYYCVLSDAITLVNPTRTGYTFAGWTGTDLDGPTMIVTIPHGSEGDRSYTATWTLDVYTIGYDLDGGYAPSIPNPDTYTFESDDITLNNPLVRVDIDEVNGNTYYLFRGWTGADLTEPTQTVTIPHGSIGDRTYTATWNETNTPFEGIEADDEYAKNEAGCYYIKMPAPEHDEEGYLIPADEDFPVRTVAIPEWFTSSFKVYDNGGKTTDDGGDYMPNPDGDYITTLILIAPEGKMFSVSGNVAIRDWDEDWLKIYDGTTTEHEIDDIYTYDSGYLDEPIIPFVTTGNSIRFDLYAEDDMTREGLDLTVSVIDAPTNITLANDDSQSEQKNSSVIASNDGELANVTLDGRTLYRDGTWNTLCLPFDIDDISVTPLRGATVKALEGGSYNAGAMTLDFSEVSPSGEQGGLQAGKPYIVKWDVDPSYNVIDGSPDVNGELSGEFVDGDTNTQWYPDENDGAFCIFEESEGIIAVTGYTLNTANVNPRAWTLEGKLNESDGWTLIDSRDATVTSADALPEYYGTDKTYTVSNPGTYRYFRFTVTIGGIYGYFNLYELTLQGDLTPDNIENPTFNLVTIKNELHPVTSETATFAGSYSTIVSTDGLLLDAHNANGDAFYATLSIGDITAPSGYTFEGWCTDEGLTTPVTTIPFDATTGNVTLYANMTENVLELASNADNSDAIRVAAANGGEFNVTLANRTLWKDGDWNTLCLPFNLTIAGSPLDGDGVEVRTLSSAGFENGILTLNFTPATGDEAVTELQAGTPYIIKWSEGSNLTENDLVFHGVTIDAMARNKSSELSDGKSITFKGTYAPVRYDEENSSVLFMGGNNKLYYPDGESAITIGACRAYFELDGITASPIPSQGGGNSSVKAFVLNFDGDDATSIDHSPLTIDHSGAAWYSLDGRRLNGKPTKSGVYVHNGRKIIIK